MQSGSSLSYSQQPPLPILYIFSQLNPNDNLKHICFKINWLLFSHLQASHLRNLFQPVFQLKCVKMSAFTQKPSVCSALSILLHSIDVIRPEQRYKLWSSHMHAHTHTHMRNVSSKNTGPAKHSISGWHWIQYKYTRHTHTFHLLCTANRRIGASPNLSRFKYFRQQRY